MFVNKIRTNHRVHTFFRKTIKIIEHWRGVSNKLRDRALFTCGDEPVHGYFFPPKIFMSIHLIKKKSLCHALVCLKKSCDPAYISDCL